MSKATSIFALSQRLSLVDLREVPATSCGHGCASPPELVVGADVVPLATQQAGGPRVRDAREAGGLALAAHDDDADARILVQRLEGQTQLVALRHRHDIVGGTAQNDVGALMRLVDLDLEPVELGKAGIDKMSADMWVDLKKHNVATVSLWAGITLTERSQIAIKEHPGEIDYVCGGHR